MNDLEATIASNVAQLQDTFLSAQMQQHANLLEVNPYLYVLALAQPHFAEDVEKSVGENYPLLLQTADLVHELYVQDFVASFNRIFDDDEEEVPEDERKEFFKELRTNIKEQFNNIQPNQREYTSDSVTIQVTPNVITADVKEKAVSSLEKLLQLELKARKLIFSEAQEFFEQHPDKLVEAYDTVDAQDSEKYARHLNEVVSEGLTSSRARFQDYPNPILRQVNLSRLSLLGGEEFLELNLDRLSARLSHISCDRPLPENIHALAQEYVLNPSEEKLAKCTEEIVAYRLQADPKLAVAEAARNIIAINLMDHEVPDCSDVTIDDIEVGRNSITELYALAALLRKKHTQEDKSTLVEVLNSRISKFATVLTGIEQVISGAVTRQGEPAISVLQNDARFPNIPYSQRTKNELDEIAEEMHALLGEFPDFSDYILSSKLKNKSSFTYTIRELDKNPLDITFGNDAGCCIAVPKDKEKFVNGEYVAHYLMHPSVRLFGLYQQAEDQKEKRVGLMIGFEGLENELAINSLELSSHSIPSRSTVIPRLVAFAEQSLAEYANQFGYATVLMGNHRFNIATRHSKNVKNNCDRDFEFKENPPIINHTIIGSAYTESLVQERGLALLCGSMDEYMYTDILTRAPLSRSIRARKNSLYVVFQAPSVDTNNGAKIQ